jgi:hypothetical protein
MTTYTVIVIRKDAQTHSTKFEGYGAETCADRWFKEQAASRHTLAAVNFADDFSIRSQFQAEDA